MSHDPLCPVVNGCVCGDDMTVWAIFRVNGHRCLSVWTSEVAAREARQPGQYVIEAHLVPTIAAVTDQVTRS